MKIYISQNLIAYISHASPFRITSKLLNMHKNKRLHFLSMQWFCIGLV